MRKRNNRLNQVSDRKINEKLYEPGKYVRNIIVKYFGVLLSIKPFLVIPNDQPREERHSLGCLSWYWHLKRRKPQLNRCLVLPNKKRSSNLALFFVSPGGSISYL